MTPSPTGSVPRDLWLRVFAHRDRLLRLARARVPDEAEDVVQEAMLRCATFPDLDEERLGELLTSVTVRLCVDEHRRRSRAEHLRKRIPLDLGDEPGADEQVCARAEAEWAAGVVRTLPAMQQVVMTERADGLSYDEISRRHRLSYKSVESSASRARAVVRRALAATLATWGVIRRPAVLAPTAVTAVAFVTLVLGTGLPGQDGARSVAEPPAQRGRVATSRPGGTTSANDVPALAPAAAQQREGPAVAAPHVAPRRTERPVVRVSNGPTLYTDERHDDYSTHERLQHCVEYGVELQPTIRCRYPDDPGAQGGRTR